MRSFAVGSLVVAVAAVAVLVSREQDFQHRRTSAQLVVLAASSLRGPMSKIADDYRLRTGTELILIYGASEDLLARARLPDAGDPPDLFLPADESYIADAARHGLIGRSEPIATMRATMLLAPGCRVESWNDLLRCHGVSLANDAAAIGRMTRQHLQRSGRWTAFEPIIRGAANVSDSANAAKIGAVEAAIVWEPVARLHPTLIARPIDELDGIVAIVRAATLNGSKRSREAEEFLKYLADADGGKPRFREAHFRPVTP